MSALARTQPGIALVTGASSGIGRSAAIALGRAGWTVVICARRADALEETGQMVQEAGGKEVQALVADLSQPDDIVRLFEAIQEDYGRLDLLFNNAGIATPRRPMHEISLEDTKQLFDVNILAPFLCCQEAIKIMIAQSPQGGRIINNGSISAYTPRVDSTAYTMSKHAISGLTKTIALDYRDYNIACSQIDIGNAHSSDSSKASGQKQANGQVIQEPRYDVDYTGEAIVYMASLPLGVNVLNQTLMATNMPFIGRG